MAEPKQYVGHHHSSSAGHSIRSPLKSKIIRSQKITTVTSPTEPPRRQDYSAHLADVDDNDEEEEEEDDEDGEEDDDDDEEEEEEEEDDDDDDDDDEDNEQVMSRAPPVTRSHTPGHLATKSHDRRGKPSELSIRHRSQSAASLSASQAPSLPASASSKVSLLSANTLYTNASATTPTPTSARSHLQLNTKTSTEADREGIAAAAARRTPGLRSTSAIASKPGAGPTVAPTPVSAPTSANVTSATSSVHKPSSTRTSRSGPRHSHHNQSNMHAHVPFPPLIDPRTAPDVPPAPSSGMYWSRAPVSGVRHTALRAHTTTMIGSNVFVFGGCDSRACFNQLYVLDADSFYWSTPHVVGDIPVPLRAMTCTAVGKKLVIFGGGDGPAYYNDVYVLDTVNFRWSRPRIVGDRVPSKRRAHTACLYKNGIYVFGGGDGVRALNDIWRLDVSDMSKMSWKLVSGPSDDNNNSGIAGGSKGKKDLRPKARGYHTANMVGSKLIIFGGSDGGECFNDVWVWDVDTALWRSVSIPQAHRRLSHTSTIVGSFLFVVGGHDGNEYSNDVLLLNLVTMTWDRRRVYGLPPSGRGYHGTVLHDSRLLVIGGFDGSEVFGEVWMLELAVHAYYSQISHFSIEV